MKKINNLYCSGNPIEYSFKIFKDLKVTKLKTNPLIIHEDLLDEGIAFCKKYRLNYIIKEKSILSNL